jgi:rare lipoprotein A
VLVAAITELVIMAESLVAMSRDEMGEASARPGILNIKQATTTLTAFFPLPVFISESLLWAILFGFINETHSLEKLFPPQICKRGKTRAPLLKRHPHSIGDEAYRVVPAGQHNQVQQLIGGPSRRHQGPPIVTQAARVAELVDHSNQQAVGSPSPSCRRRLLSMNRSGVIICMASILQPLKGGRRAGFFTAVLLSTATFGLTASGAALAQSTNSDQSVTPKKKVITGKASFYGGSDGFDGQTTANGDTFDHHEHTAAATKAIPLGSTAKVTNLKTGKSTVVTVTDRGPYVPGRKIDLSKDAAKEIGITKKEGVAPVKIEVTKPPVKEASVP